jgi:hypothetical protein
MRLIVPEQILEFRPSSPGRWAADMIIDGVDYRVEAYQENGGQMAQELIDQLYDFAICGGPLHQHEFPDGTKAYVCVMPKGGTC